MADRIDRTLRTPLYHQLERILREDIDNGVYPAGELLPSESEICERYDVSRSVVRQTLANLAHAGLVHTEKVGRTRQCRLGTERLDEAMAWISHYQRLWERRLDGLEAYLTLQEGRPR